MALVIAGIKRLEVYEPHPPQSFLVHKRRPWWQEGGRRVDKKLAIVSLEIAAKVLRGYFENHKNVFFVTESSMWLRYGVEMVGKWTEKDTINKNLSFNT